MQRLSTSMPATGYNRTTGRTSVRPWSLFGQERVGGDYGRFVQGPVKGEEDAVAIRLRLPFRSVVASSWQATTRKPCKR